MPEQERAIMTRYQDLCDAYFEWEPQQVEINRIFREVPPRMKQAILGHLQPPSVTAEMPTHFLKTPTGYADLYRKGFDQNGEKTWERCPDHECLTLRADGIRQFVIGVCMERTPESLTSSMMYFTFSIESVDLQSVDLRVENLDSKILIDLRDPSGFAKAAAQTIDLLIDFLKSPSGSHGNRTPIGFAAPV
jgi:hypothetical protein